MTAPAFDVVRIAIGKVEALAHAVETMFDGVLWPPGVDRQAIERLASLIGATHEAAQAALDTVDAANSDLANATPATGAGWSDEP